MKRLPVVWPAVQVAVRTAGALMVGNVFVAFALLNNRNVYGLIGLLAWGLATIIMGSVKWE